MIPTWGRWTHFDEHIFQRVLKPPTRLWHSCVLILTTCWFRFLDDHNSAPVAYAILTGISYPVLQNFCCQQHGVGGINWTFALCMVLKTRLGYQMDYGFGTMFSSLCVTRLGLGDLGCCLAGGNTLSFKGLVLFACRGIMYHGRGSNSIVYKNMYIFACL